MDIQEQIFKLESRITDLGIILKECDLPHEDPTGRVSPRKRKYQTLKNEAQEELDSLRDAYYNHG